VRGRVPSGSSCAFTDFVEGLVEGFVGTAEFAEFDWFVSRGGRAAFAPGEAAAAGADAAS
jgi:hypothetical protein